MNKASLLSAPTIIVADDSPEIVIVLTRLLELCDCKIVATAKDGEEAIKLVNQVSANIIFIDIEMPIKSGFDVLDTIKSNHISIYPIMISGHSSIENNEAAVKRGAKGFIVKPPSQKKVEEIIAEYFMFLKKENNEI